VEEVGGDGEGNFVGAEKGKMINTIFNEDCLVGMQRLANDSVDMILADLPYGLTQNTWDSQIPLTPLWESFWRVLKPTGVIALTASQPFTSVLVSSQIEFFRHEWIWIKNRGSNFANTVREPMKEHESVLIFSRGKWTYNKQMQERTGAGLDRVKYNVAFKSGSKNYRQFEERNENKLPELRVPSSWQKFNTEVGLHPTQKPVPLFEYLIKTYTNPNEVVLDPCLGSGTTAIACMNLGRKYIGFEINLEYFVKAQERILLELERRKR